LKKTLVGLAHLLRQRFSGFITPGKTFGPWGKVAAAAFVAYWTGKLTYILGNNCKEKFLRQVNQNS
jgi:hypothetical protein